MSEIVCVINPMSNGGRTLRTWQGLAAKLAAAGVVAEARFTSGPGDGTTLTRRALAEGAQTVIAVGGDGTINEVANGFFAGDMAMNANARLGILPAGSGSDLIKTLGIPKGSDAAIALIASGTDRLIDLGRATFTNRAGDQESRRFINIASAGLSGEVLNRMEKLPSILSGALRYNLASLITMASYNPPPVTITLDDDEPQQTRVLMLVISNGRYFGGGMHVAPDARIDDAELDLVAILARPLPELLINFPKIYAGTHLDLSMVEQGRGRRITVNGETPLKLEIDGEQLGVTPAIFEVVPGALRVICPVSI